MDTALIERILFISIIVILAFAILRYKLFDFLIKKKRKKRFARGMLLENQAHSYLESIGYSVIDTQKVLHHQYEINGIKQSSKLILDYIVQKAGKKYIVEVKSGKSAISMSNSNTRRQLLEYDFSIQNNGIFLLDMENEKMQKIKFTSKAETEEKHLRNVIIGLAVLGTLLPFWKIKIILILIIFAIWKFPLRAESLIKSVKELR